MTNPCRTSQHCAYHGWCNRCDPALAEVMSEINAVIQRECTEHSRWGTLYKAIAAILHPVHTREEEVVGELNEANVRLARDLAARNAQLGVYVAQLQLEQHRLSKARELHRENCPVAQAKVSEAFTCSLCETLGMRPVVPEEHTDGHIYLSTGCLHDDHKYCQSMTGIQGSKRGGKCKHCDAQCICTCHTEETHVVADDSADPEHVEDCPGCETTDTPLQEMRCNQARTRWSHVPHEWEPQPGMVKLYCPGFPEGDQT